MTESPQPKSPQPKPGVLQIHAYKAGESTIPGKTRVIKLASNESPFGPSPRAVDAARGAVEHLELYPDGSSLALRTAIGAAYGLDPALIVAGTGSEQILNLLAQCYAGPGDEVIQTEFGFLVYSIATHAVGADLVVAKDRDYRVDVDAVLAAVSDKTRLVFLANPNNPTGTMLPASEIRRLREGLPGGVLLVIDAAYAEYVTDPAYSAGHELVCEAIQSGADNVVVAHTFSKIYGLASQRLGWCFAPARVVDALNRVRTVFNVSTIAQAAGIAALQDKGHVEHSRQHNARWLEEMTAALTGMGLRVPPAAGNFLLVEFPPRAGQTGGDQAAAADQHFRGDGIIVRPVGVYGLAHCLRITIGTDAENEAVIDSLQRFMAG